MNKEARLTVRIPDALDVWLEEEGAALGLDKSTYARTILFQAMNGRPAPARMAQPEPIQDASLQFDTPDDDGEQEPPMSDESPDIDALVAARLAEAESRGVIESRTVAQPEPSPADQMLTELGVKPFRRAQMPSFGHTSPRIERRGSLA